MKKGISQNTFFFFRFICLMMLVQIIFTNNVNAEQNTTFVSNIQPNLRFHRITDDNGLYQKHINIIYQDSQDFLWLDTEGGLVRYDGYNFKQFSNEPFDKNLIFHNKIIDIYEDRSNRLWISTGGGGLNLFDHDTEIFYHFKNDPSNPNSLWSDILGAMCEDKTGAIWVATSNGITKIQFLFFQIFYLELSSILNLKPLKNSHPQGKINLFFCNKYFFIA